MSELTSLHGAMDRLFGDVFWESLRGPQIEDPSRLGAPTYRLPVDIVEVENGYRIQAPVPGFRPEDVEVTVSDGALTITAKRSEEKTRQAANYLVREIGYGNLKRQVSLPSDVRVENIKASFDNGLLTLEIPRAPKPKPQRIAIQHGEQAQPTKQKQAAAAGSKSR